MARRNALNVYTMRCSYRDSVPAARREEVRTIKALDDKQAIAEAKGVAAMYGVKAFELHQSMRKGERLIYRTHDDVAAKEAST